MSCHNLKIKRERERERTGHVKYDDTRFWHCTISATQQQEELVLTVQTLFILFSLSLSLSLSLSTYFSMSRLL